MNRKRLDVSVLSILCAFLLALIIISPAYAQMGRGENKGSGMGPMMHGYGFEKYDSRFEGFGLKTFKEIADTFGVPVRTAVSDLGLPDDLDTGLTIAEIEEQYGVSGQEIASYMVMNMTRMHPSLNAEDQLTMRQQAIRAIRVGAGHGMSFMHQGSFAYGNFTTYNFNESGVIENFAAGGDPIFDSVAVSDFNYLDKKITGATAFYQGVDSQIFLQDSPMGILQVRAFANKTVTFDLADGVRASLDEKIVNQSGNPVPIKITKNDFEGYLVVFMNPLSADPEENLNVLDARISDDKINVNLAKNNVIMFRANSMHNVFMQNRHRFSPEYAHMHRILNREIITGKVGAEAVFRVNEVSVINYAPVNLQVRERDKNHIVLGIASETPEARVITVNMDNETFDFLRTERLRLRYDGTVVEKTGSIDELFAGGNIPLYYLLENNGTATVVIYIPRFSEHEIIIDFVPEGTENITETEKIPQAEQPETEGNATEPESTPAFELGFAVAGLAAGYCLGRKL